MCDHDNIEKVLEKYKKLFAESNIPVEIYDSFSQCNEWDTTLYSFKDKKTEEDEYD